jgi:tRNA(Ile)-lysidine synthase
VPRRSAAEPELIPPALVERFRADWHVMTGAMIDQVVVAFSGGPDSTALLLLARAALGDRCRAATVDHALRPESAAEAEAAHAFCQNRGIPHAILAGPLPPRAAGSANISARARALRLSLLEAHRRAVGAQWIATAHHADDQLETFVMRANRGAGVAGLAGIRVTNGRLIRPVIEWRRRELLAIVEAAGLDVVADPTNDDDRYDRARLRKLLAVTDLLDADRVAKSARALGKADEALEFCADMLIGALVEQSGERVVLATNRLPDELLRRLTLRCLRMVDRHVAPRSDRFNSFVDRLDSDQPATLSGIKGTVSYGERGRLFHFAPAPPRRSV